MKGVINSAIAEMVKKKFGPEAWAKITQEAGVPEVFLATSSYPDEYTLRIVEAACKVLNLTPRDVFRAFAEHWMLEFAPRVYTAFFKTPKNAKEFLKEMDRIHSTMTRTLTEANPPRFKYEEPDEKTLIIHYFSQRKLPDLVEELIRAVGKYYGEELQIQKITSDKEGAVCAFEVKFP